MHSPERIDETVGGLWSERLRHTDVPATVSDVTIVTFILAINVSLQK